MKSVLGQSDAPNAASPSPSGPSRLDSVRALVPGIALSACAAVVAMGVRHFVPTLSPLLIAIVLGALTANLVVLPASFGAGITFSSKKLLRVGISLLGLQLVLGDILGLGWGVIAMVVAIVVLGIIGTMFVGSLLGLSWTQRVLIACGFSICGAAAVAAADGVVEADEEEVLTAVALVVIFGTLMIPTIPLISSAIGFDDTEAGLWAGGSIHEVAQVVAAGGIIGGAALTVATIVKLARVLMLAPVMAALSIMQRRRTIGQGTTTKRPPLIPLFVLAFLGLVVIRSTGILPAGLLSAASSLQTALLTAAMFALGAGVRIATIKKVGIRPFILAAASTVWVAVIALVGVMMV
ncbi:putative integral membrane protein (TIGR00698 family) [Rhodococcus sp. AG1013]|uniref:YeiH family protein n=1 Tax=Rhodococcus sp. AG1013 TaxID=2183996 RepID=UPI000E0C7C0E|nr:putative sulfate exporter family transporter [Rhodococcus sp. AG1013]RDI35535.1 putative integral membrane protein (TIGR00698 family) [Rhodococcus sp. AG1013]